MIHPAIRWQKAAWQEQATPNIALRLAAMSGHMQHDQIAARRAALVDLLADGRPHTRENILTAVCRQLGTHCWGKRPREALLRDLNTLRRGGLRIAYSRRPQTQGYYLQHPPLKQPPSPFIETTNWQLIDQIKQLSVAEKNKCAFAAADFALQQKRLLLAQQHPDWPAKRVERVARQLVFGTGQ